MTSAWQTAHVRDLLRTFDVEHQLSIPFNIDGVQHQAIVLTRPAGSDFSPDDMRLAASIQPALAAMHQQAGVLDQARGENADRRVLTGRELAVLACISRGCRRRVTSRWLVEFLDTVRVSCSDYAAVSSGMLTSSGSASRSAMECSLK